MRSMAKLALQLTRNHPLEIKSQKIKQKRNMLTLVTAKATSLQVQLDPVALMMWCSLSFSFILDCLYFPSFCSQALFTWQMKSQASATSDTHFQLQSWFTRLLYILSQDPVSTSGRILIGITWTNHSIQEEKIFWLAILDHTHAHCSSIRKLRRGDVIFQPHWDDVSKACWTDKCYGCYWPLRLPAPHWWW